MVQQKQQIFIGHMLLWGFLADFLSDVMTFKMFWLLFSKTIQPLFSPKYSRCLHTDSLYITPVSPNYENRKATTTYIVKKSQ